MIYKSGHHYSPLLQLVQYTTARLFSVLQSINRYTFCILNAYLPSEATSLKTSIIFITGTMGTHAPFIALKASTHQWARDLCFLADGIVNVQTTRKEHLAIYVGLGDVNLQHPPWILVPSPMVPY